MRKVSVVLVAMLFMIGWTFKSEACPTPAPKCVCDCNAKCMYGEVCKKVQECNTYKTCKTVKVCSYDKHKCCKKVKVCHIPPGNPANAHTLCISQSAVVAHLGNHGDYLGDCKYGCHTEQVCTAKKCCKTVNKCECAQRDPKCPVCECPGPQDAGVKPDREVPVDPDQGSPRPDKGVSWPDMRTPKADMGYVQFNDGYVVQDSGVPEPDCGTCVPVDPKTVENDLELVGGGGCNVGNTNSFGLGVIMLLGLFFLLRKKAISAVIMLSLLFAIPAFAAPPVNNFKTAPSFNDYYTTMSPKTLGHLDFNAQLVLNYAHKPLRVIDKATGETVDTVVRFRMNVDLAMALGLLDWLEIGVVVPMSAGQGAGNLDHIKSELNVHDFELADMKDMRIVPKVKLLTVDLGNYTYFNVGFALPITAPTGDRDRLLGENGPSLTPTLLAGLEHKNFSVGLNVGALVRFGQYYEYRNQTITNDNAFLYGLGVNIPLVEGDDILRRLDLVGDLWGSVEFNEQDKEEVGLEAMGGLRAHLKHGVVMNVGAGGGITKGYGVPEYRVMWGFGWQFDYQKPADCPTCVCKDCKPVVKIVEKVVPVIKEKVLVLPPVYFDTDKSILRPDAVKILNKTVALLKKNPWVKKIRLEGHCDFRASNKYNEALGWRRVYAVRNYLIDKGVEMKKLEARGYGETQPVDGRKEEPGLQKNRRVEFHILEVK